MPKPVTRTRVFQAREHSSSIKGTIPSDVASALKLKDSDVIEWEVAAEGGEIIAKVRKVSNVTYRSKERENR